MPTYENLCPTVKVKSDLCASSLLKSMVTPFGVFSRLGVGYVTTA